MAHAWIAVETALLDNSGTLNAEALGLPEGRRISG